MNETRLTQSRIANGLKMVVLFTILAGLLGFLAYIIAGRFVALMVFLMITVAYVLSPTMPPRLVMRFFKAKPLAYRQAPQLHRMLKLLSSRAGLENLPDLYVIPSEALAAFAAGDVRNSAMALSTGLLSRLAPEEIAGVTAHEISHIRNNDMKSMWFALVLSRVTELMSMAGQVLLFINLPLILVSGININWLPIGVLILAPSLSYLVQLSLSRINEFNADLGSAQLLGSPEPLISALSKIEYGQRGFFGHLFPQKRPANESSLFRTHPPTDERIRRLKKIRVAPSSPFALLRPQGQRAIPTQRPGLRTDGHPVWFV